MSVRLDPRQLAEARLIVPAPRAPDARACEDRNFGLPTLLFKAYFGLFLGFLGVMAMGFSHPEMAIPFVIFAFFTAAFYVVPALWAGMKPDHGDRPMGMDALLARGIDTQTGRLSGGSAMVQMLILPVLVFLWGLVAVAIAAL